MCKLTLAGLVSSIIGLHSLVASAVEPQRIDWNDLLPVKVFEDPFEKLNQKQLDDLGHVVRIRTLIEANKIKPNGPSAREAAQIQQRLKKDGVDIAWLLSQRQQVRRLREIQVKAVQPDVEGKIVQLAGFVVPLKTSGELVTEFLLVPNFDACYHSAPPPPNQAVYVRLDKGISSQSPVTAVRVTGRIEAKQTKRTIQRTDGPTIISAAYSLALDRIEVYATGKQ